MLTFEYEFLNLVESPVAVVRFRTSVENTVLLQTNVLEFVSKV